MQVRLLQHCGHAIVITAAFALGCSLAACGGETGSVSAPGDTRSGKPVVYTTFYPTQYFTERIAGGIVDVICPVPADADAIFWKPGPEMIQKYQEASLIVLNGAGFAKWVEQVSLPENRVVDSCVALKSQFIQYEEAKTHTHGKAGEHSHEGTDGHTWVDPVLAKAQAAEISRALKKRFPEHAEAFEKGYAALAADLDALDAKLKSMQPATRGVPVLASHPAYNYIARRYEWNLRNLDLDPEEMPDDKTFASIRDGLTAHPAKAIIWEAQPRAEIAQRFQDDLGLKSIVFSPCELLGAEEQKEGADYLSVMKANIERLPEAFR